MSVAATRVAEFLGGPKVLGRQIGGFSDLHALIVQGMPAGAARYLDGILSSATAGKVIESAFFSGKLGLKDRVRLLSDEAQIVERIARLYAQAIDAFEDAETAREFMISRHPRLENARPIDLASTEIGGRLVEALLDSIEHSLPA